jgi:hypothetical protein
VRDEIELTPRNETLATEHVRTWFGDQNLGSARVARRGFGALRPDME